MLATDLRPSTLDQVVGQSIIVKSLKNYFKKNTLPNVLYFIGHSGSGKNTFSNIIASTLNCENLDNDSDGIPIPCGICGSCKDISEGKFQRDVHNYNGEQLKAENVNEIESILDYAPKYDRNIIIIINEAHATRSIGKFKEIIENPSPNVYFIMTSTDKAKFKNTGISKDNKDQELNASRSRGAMFELKPIETKLINDCLFSLLEKFDNENKVPDSFFGVMLLISENSKGNIRQAINDFSQCLESEIYTESEAIDLLGYEDEKEMYNLSYMLAVKNTQVLKQMELKGWEESYNYIQTVLSSIVICEITGYSNKEEWQIKNSKAIVDTSHFNFLISIFSEMQSKFRFGFDSNVFKFELYRYFNVNEKLLEKTENILKKELPKKIKTLPTKS